MKKILVFTVSLMKQIISLRTLLKLKIVCVFIFSFLSVQAQIGNILVSKPSCVSDDNRLVEFVISSSLFGDYGCDTCGDYILYVTNVTDPNNLDTKQTIVSDQKWWGENSGEKEDGYFTINFISFTLDDYSMKIENKFEFKFVDPTNNIIASTTYSFYVDGYCSGDPVSCSFTAPDTYSVCPTDAEVQISTGNRQTRLVEFEEEQWGRVKSSINIDGTIYASVTPGDEDYKFMVEVEHGDGCASQLIELSYKPNLPTQGPIIDTSELDVSPDEDGEGDFVFSFEEENYNGE